MDTSGEAVKEATTGGTPLLLCLIFTYTGPESTRIIKTLHRQLGGTVIKKYRLGKAPGSV